MDPSSASDLKVSICTIGFALLLCHKYFFIPSLITLHLEEDPLPSQIQLQWLIAMCPYFDTSMDMQQCGFIHSK